MLPGREVSFLLEPAVLNMNAVDLDGDWNETICQMGHLCYILGTREAVIQPSNTFGTLSMIQLLHMRISFVSSRQLEETNTAAKPSRL